MVDIVGQNTGLIIEKRETNWIAGGTTGIVYQSLVPDGQWDTYLSRGERQSNLLPQARFDSMACVSYSVLNSYEAQMNRIIMAGEMTVDNLQWLNTNGYIGADGKVNCSDRFLAFTSGTRPTGNTFERVGDAARKIGLVPEAKWAWDASKAWTWDEWYAQPPKELYDLALAFLERFSLAYEEVRWQEYETKRPAMRTARQQAPLWIATAVCPGWHTDAPVKNCNSYDVTHAHVEYGDNEIGSKIEDQYEPFRKVLEYGYPIPYVFKPVITQKNKKYMNDEIKVIKKANSPAVGFWIPATSEAALISLGATLGKEIKRKPDGAIDFDATVEGTLTLK